MRNYQSRISKKNTNRRKKLSLIAGLVFTLILLVSSAFFLSKNVQATGKFALFNKSTNSVKPVKPKKAAIKSKPNSINIKDTASNSKTETENKTVPADPLPEQTTQPAAVVTTDGSKTVYLTFDDGPSANNTPKILEILKNENVKATFFVIGSMAEKNPGLLKQEAAEGHAIGNHSYSHSLDYNHSTPAAFMEDFKKGDMVITSIIGNHDRSLIRFPGGSFRRTAFQEAARAAGYRYVDWNCLTGDAEVSLAPVDRLLRRFHETFESQKELIILMHDAPNKVTTPEALPQIIQFLKANGYTFKTL